MSNDNTDIEQVDQVLLDNGWIHINKSIVNGILPEKYGVKSVYGMRDNYFDISMGYGSDITLKIIDVISDKCIRYLYVKENTTYTASQIPPGVYYLKIAYGYDWVEKEFDSNIYLGKFSKKQHYMKSVDLFDFGKKNSKILINYKLDINIADSDLENNFETEEITEEEFYNNQ